MSAARNDQTCRFAVVLLSGGLDSATTLAIAKSEGFVCHALSFDYGQRHGAELKAARHVGQQLGAATHRTIKINRAVLAGSAGPLPCRGSALIDPIDVPKDRSEQQMAEGIPVTYVPARNTIFLSHALALAEILSCSDIFLGVNAVDYSGYPDCRPEYVEAFETMANLATKAAVAGQRIRIHTPLIDLPKTEIVRKGLELGVDYGLTHSCYDPDLDRGRPTGCRPCGRCDACLLRMRAFQALGMTDPLLP